MFSAELNQVLVQVSEIPTWCYFWTVLHVLLLNY